MPNLSQANAQRFDGLRDHAVQGIKKINRARREAVEEGDTETARQLTEARKALRDQLEQIDEAEAAFIRSAMTVAQAQAELQQAGRNARAAVQSVKDVASGLAAVSAFVSSIARLITVFT